MLTKEQILTAQDLEYRDEKIPEWPDENGKPGIVRVWEITAEDKDAFEESISILKQVGKKMKAEINRQNYRAKLVARCLGDENGNRLFSEKEVIRLGRKSAKVIDRLFKICQELNGMGEDQEEDFLLDSDKEE